MGEKKLRQRKHCKENLKKTTSCQQSQQKNTHEKLKGGAVNELCF